MAEAFDPYLKWLGIAPEDQPPDLYRLLGVPTFVDDADVIESGAERQMAHVRRFQSGSHSELTQQILNEISKARVTLLNPLQKEAYDEQLRKSIAILDVSHQPEESVPSLTRRPTKERKKPSTSTQMSLIIGTVTVVVFGLLAFTFVGFAPVESKNQNAESSSKPKQEEKPNRIEKNQQPEPRPRLPANLLEKIQLAAHTNGESWRRDGESLVYQSKDNEDGGDGGLATIPVEIDSDRYEVELTFTRHAGDYRVSLILPVGQRHCSAVLSVTIDGRAIFGGLAMLNGKRIWRHRTRRKHPNLRDGKVHRLHCLVQTKDGTASISMSLDGAPVTSWTGPITALSVESFEKPASTNRLAIYSSSGHTEFHSLKLK